MSTITPIAKQFIEMLQQAEAHSKQRHMHFKSAEKVHIVGAGGTLTAAYEQLRNAAEYTEEHLLLQRAIRRFYRRLFLTRDAERIGTCGEELAVELTLAGYLANDSLPTTIVTQISQESARYFTYYQHVLNSGNASDAEDWGIATLAVRVEGLLTDHANRAAFVQFAYRYFVDSIDAKVVYGATIPDSYDTSVFIAVHRMLLKSDNATIRQALLDRYQASPDNIEQFTTLNKHLDVLLAPEVAEKIGRIINRQGAPLRVLWRMVTDTPDLARLMQHRDKFLAAYEAQIMTEYQQMNTKINRGIAKSVIFLIITKFLIGIAIEVPYDYIFHGSILWVVLIINLLFPPIYMILLRLTLVLPGRANTMALIDRMDAIVYAERPNITLTPTSGDTGSYSNAFNVLYGCLFVLVFGGVGWGLWLLGFSVVHLVIFFMFLSTASFLGFRLSRLIREIEAVETEQNGVLLIRDFLYLPFVVVGRWISENYAKVNVVTLILDMVIELPLKTVIRLVQQWGKFISSKQDEL
ncbi:MAG: hypothetical protein WAS27_02010 [Candidatus Saccharimonadales bacterium]